MCIQPGSFKPENPLLAASPPSWEAADILTAPAPRSALQTQPHMYNWIILVCPAGLTPPVQGKLVA